MRTDGEKKIVAIFNFSEKEQEYILRLQEANSLQLLLASDNEIYGGNTAYNNGAGGIGIRVNLSNINHTDFRKDKIK